MKKIYKIDGGESYSDYGALTFKDKYQGKRVGDVCEELLNGKDSYDDDNGFGICIEEEINDSDIAMFIKMRDKGDYDDMKHEVLLMEDEIITK